MIFRILTQNKNHVSILLKTSKKDVLFKLLNFFRNKKKPDHYHKHDIDLVFFRKTSFTKAFNS